MRYEYDENNQNPKAIWHSLKGAMRRNKKTHEIKPWWINSQSFIDEMIKKYYNDAIRIANTIRTPLLSDADKESFALEGLYEAAGTYDPSHLGEQSNRPAAFTTYLMLRIRSILLRELKLARMQKRGLSVDITIDDQVFKTHLREIDNTSTAKDRWADNSQTAMDLYYKPEATKLPFDLEDILQKLQEARVKLNTTQFGILKSLLNDDTNESKIAKELGITRQMVNLHVKVIRKHLKLVLNQVAPDFNIGE